MTSSRRDFFRSVAALPIAAVRTEVRRQLVLRLDIKESPVVRGHRLIMSFDLWGACVRPIGGEAALSMVGNFVPAEPAIQISKWLYRQEAVDSLLRKNIPINLMFHECGIPISLWPLAEFFAKGEFEIVPFSGAVDE